MHTASLPEARPRSDRFRCGGRESKSRTDHLHQPSFLPLAELLFSPSCAPTVKSKFLAIIIACLSVLPVIGRGTAVAAERTLTVPSVTSGGKPIPAQSQTVSYQATGEEFVGPFASWKNVKTDFGAKGDGVTDDAPAIQKALDELKEVQTNNWSVLYFPAGRYRLGSTLRTERTKHSDYLGVQIIGEDPATTVLLWGGPDNGTMLAFDSWFSRVSRLTFDGWAGKPSDGGVSINFIGFFGSLDFPGWPK